MWGLLLLRLPALLWAAAAWDAADADGGTGIDRAADAVTLDVLAARLILSSVALLSCR